jgi:hypothetical protein
MAYSQNLAYKKANFFKVKGFINHMKINNGIGDLFIKDAYKDKNTTFCISENSFIETTIPTSFSQWFTNKKEEIIITKNYQFKHRFLLSFFTITKTFFYILAILFFFLYPFKIILSIVLVYFLTQYIVIGISAKKLKEPYILFFLPFLEIILLSIQISIFIANSFSKPKHWR